MATLNVVLSVRFRAFGITFANINQQWNEPLPAFVEALTGPRSLVVYNDHGVALTITLKP